LSSFLYVILKKHNMMEGNLIIISRGDFYRENFQDQ